MPQAMKVGKVPRRNARNGLLPAALDMGWVLIFKAISDPLVVIDGRGWVVYANPAWIRLTACEQDDWQPYHITRELPALMMERGEGNEAGLGISDKPMMIKDRSNGMVAVMISARPLPGASLMVIQARTVSP